MTRDIGNENNREIGYFYERGSRRKAKSLRWSDKVNTKIPYKGNEYITTQ